MEPTEQVQTESRILAGVPELREATGTKPKLVGYAAVFNSKTDIAGLFTESIRPGAFARAIGEKQDVRALIDHNSSLILGRTTAGTLVLSEDDHGLRVEIDPPDTTAGRDIMESIRRGDVSGMSFTFRTIKDEWDISGDLAHRTLVDLDIEDVGPVTYPAYTATAISLRSAKAAVDEAKRVISEVACSTDGLGIYYAQLRLAEADV
jgi:HK97 family phage prohead protease